jgi:hypothetical protein
VELKLLKIGRGGSAANDFREEYGIDQRGPFRVGDRPESNDSKRNNNATRSTAPNFLANACRYSNYLLRCLEEKLMRFNASG